MHMVIVAANDASADPPAHGVVCHDVRNPHQRSEVLVRKGTPLSAHDVDELLSRGVGELHLAVPESGDTAEDDAATRLAVALAGPSVSVSDANFGQTSFVSAARGMLRVNSATVDRVNTQEGVLLLTAEADRPVEAGATLGVIKCAPLFLPDHTLKAVEDIVADVGPALELEAFRPMRVALVAPRERLRGGAFERARTALSQAIDWYGSTLSSIEGADASVHGMATAYRQALNEGVGLVLAAGASGTDPLDMVFEGLRRAGGQVEQIGIPAEPGTACWIGHLGSTPVLGLASCELFGQPGALDLLLPRLFTGEALDRQVLRRVALGGLLHGPSRVAPYHTGVRSAD